MIDPKNVTSDPCSPVHTEVAMTFLGQVTFPARCQFKSGAEASARDRESLMEWAKSAFAERASSAYVVGTAVYNFTCVARRYNLDGRVPREGEYWYQLTGLVYRPTFI